MTENYEKMKVSLRYWLLGKGFFKAVEAMNFAEKYHNGLRKNGAHEFSHQVSQAHLARTIIQHLRYKEETFIVIFLHDICEDKGITFEEIDRLFGPIVGAAVRLITKVYKGEKKDNKLYYFDMGECPLTSVCKIIDRINNLMTMLGGFKPEKRISYITETRDFTIPMAKTAKRNFPDQEGAYENLKFIMMNQIQLYDALDKSHK
jgi:(p)ppGpp synthase/HD superfamily hydrolase